MGKYTVIGFRIKQLRGASSQRSFAEKLELSLMGYQNYESGKRIPPGPVLAKLAEIGHVSVDWILTGVEPGAELRVAEAPAPYGLDDMSEKIVAALQGLSDAGKADVLDYIEKVKSHFMERPPRARRPRPVPIDFDEAARYFLQLYEFAESVGLGDKVDEIVERTIAELKEEHARSTKEAHGHKQ